MRRGREEERERGTEGEKIREEREREREGGGKQGEREVDRTEKRKE